MKLLNTFLNKVSKKDFKNMIKSVAALKLFASSMQDEDILRSLYVLSFNDIPNKDFSIKEAITRRADAKEKLNLVERQLIAKEVCTVLKNASALFDSELANITNNDNNFIQPKNPEFIKSAKFGLLANVNGKYHLVNPLTNRVASEFIIEAADERYAKLHELVGQYRKENKISYFDESDGMMILTGSPEVINDVEHKVKDIGYYCESVNEETGADGEVPEYSLKIFINTTAAPEFDIEKAAAKHEKVGEDSKFSYWLQLEDNYNDDGYLDSKNVGDHLGFFYVTEKGTQAPALLVSQLGFSGDGLTAQRTYPTKSNEPGKTYLYEEYGYTDDDFADAYNFLNDGLKNVSPEMNQKNLDGLKVDNIDTTNPNLEKDNPMLNSEGAMGEVVEKTSAEKSVEKKAEEKIDFEKELMEAGESKGKKDKVNKEQLEMGKKVEKEHTTNPEIAEKITRDHLAEIPDYYTHLEEMENNAKKNNEVKSSYAPFITIDATTTDEVKVVAGEKVVGTCKTIQAAFEKTADWSSEELLIDDGTGVTVTYQVYDDESELPVVWAALRHRDNGNVIMCSDATYVGDLLGAEDHIDFLKDIKDFSKEFAKVGLDEEKVQHYQDQTNAKLKEIFQSKPELGAQSSAKPEVQKEVDNKNQEFVDPEGNTHTFIISVDEKSEHPYKLQHLINNKEVGFESVDFEADIKQSIQHIKDAYSSLNKGLSKKADEELKQFDMKQELDGQKEFEKQDDSLKDVSIPEEKEDTSEVNEAMSAKPTQNKGESFSASEFGNNLAYIKQNNPEDFESIMANLKQLMVGDQKPMYDFLELWSQNNFQNFTETTRIDPTYERHSQYQEQLKNNVLPKVMEMSEYKKAMEEKVSAEKGA